MNRVLVLALLLVACDDEDAEPVCEVSESGLAGTIAGDSWTYINGALLEEDGSDDDTTKLALWSSDGRYGPRVLVVLPDEVGEVDLGGRYTVTFATEASGADDTGGDPTVTRSGILRIDELEEDWISGGLCAEYDDDNVVNGVFTVDIDPK